MLKKTTAILLAAIFILTAITAFAITPDYDRLLGDINDDGRIDGTDYLLCKRVVFGTYQLDESQRYSADINGDDTVDSIDYILIKRHSFGTYTIVQPTTDDTTSEETTSDTSSDSGESDVGNDNSNDNSNDSGVVVAPNNVVSVGKKYTVSVEANSRYPDTYNCELTDMIYGVSTSYYSGAFSGYNSSFDITVDLEQDGIDISKIELSYLSVDTAGIYIPASVVIYASDDQASWQKLGNLEIPAFKSGAVMSAVLELESFVSYRYICYSVTRSASWVFIDEILVYSGSVINDGATSGSINDSYNASTITEESIEYNRELMSTGESVNKSLGMTAVSKGCGYTIDCANYDWRSSTSTTVLTDGSETCAPFELESWIGIENREQSASITVDLGKIHNDIFGFSLHSFNRPYSNIYLPNFVEVEVSKNGKDFVTIGVLYATSESQENFAYSLFLNELLGIRYVRFVLSSGGSYCWIEEIEVFANHYDTTTYPSGNLYGSFDFVTTSVASYWKRTFDYNSKKNLISGLKQEIVSDIYLDYNSSINYNAPENTTLLTDGVTTNNTDCYNGYWCQFHRGDGRKIFYDLGYISSISAFSIRFLNNDAYGIYHPDNVKLVLSENGTDWYVASDIVISETTQTIVTVSANLDKSYRARYAMFYFDVKVHVFVDEITLTGKKNVNNAAFLTSLDEYYMDFTNLSGEKNNYAAPSEDLIGGAEDVCLIYHNIITANQDFFLPYVAYLDKQGNVLDTLFDAYLFLPSTASLPSGGHAYASSYASDWNYLFDDMFASNKNFDALDKTVAFVKDELALSDYKLKVFVTIPHMDTTLDGFGDIDGDGINDSLLTLEGRVAVARKYAERVILKFASMNYENIELCGFYWFHESIYGDDIDTAKAVNALMDELGYDMFWIPYFSASGYSRWKEFGFDVGCLQPNYAFSLDVDVTRIETAATLAKNYGMCIEIELDGSELSDKRFFNKYMGYLSGGVKFGYMNDCIHMYYQGGNTISAAYHSSDDKVRLIYNYTYQFIKGTLDITPDVVSEIKKSTSANTSLNGDLNSTNDVTKQYCVAFSPEHGSVTIAENGKFVYYPNKGFTGTDTFTYRVGNYLGWSEECVVTVTVG